MLQSLNILITFNFDTLLQLINNKNLLIDYIFLFFTKLRLKKHQTDLMIAAAEHRNHLRYSKYTIYLIFSATPCLKIGEEKFIRSGAFGLSRGQG